MCMVPVDRIQDQASTRGNCVCPAAVQRRRLALIIFSLCGLLLLAGWYWYPTPALAQQPTAVDAPDSPDIIGGQEAEPGAWLWQAALIYDYYGNAHAGHFCGGSLIDAQWVLTAAHCVEDQDADDIDIVLGRHQLSLDDGERITVTQIIIHPLYTGFETGADLALIRLATPSRQPILPIDTDTTTLAEGRALRATTTGYGVTDPFSYNSSDLLRQLTLPFASRAQCNVWQDLGVEVGDDMICAGYARSGKSACYGDSGGPLMIPSDNAAGWLTVGIVSWGPYGCIRDGYYGVYTRVASYADWIQQCLADPNAGLCLGGDQYEPDNTATTATLLSSDGMTQTHNFQSRDDTDWFAFDAIAGQRYVMTTEGLSAKTDTILWLLASDGKTALAYSDDISAPAREGDMGDYNSRIVWQASSSGRYYLQVENRWEDSSAYKAFYQMQLIQLTYLYHLPLVAR